MPDALRRGRTASSSPRCIRRATDASAPRRPAGPRGSGAHDQPPEAATRSTAARADGVQSFSTGSKRPAYAGRAPPPADRPPLLSPPRSGRLADWRRNTEERTEGPGEQPESESPNPADPSTATALPMRSRIRRPTTPGTSARVPCVPASSAHVQLRDRSRLPSLRGTGGPAQVRHRRGGEGGSRGRPLAGRAPEACQEPPGAAKARARACRRQPWRPLENPGTAKLPDRRGTSPTQAAGMAGGPRPGEESS